MYAEDKIPYAISRYRKETLRLFKVLDTQLEDQEHICGEYSIVDMACWPWVLTYKSQKIDLGDFPNVRRWYDLLKTRPGLRRGYDLLKEYPLETRQTRRLMPKRESTYSELLQQSDNNSG